MTPKQKFDSIKKAHEEGELVVENAYVIQFGEIVLNRFDNEELHLSFYFNEFKIEPLDNSEYSTLKKYKITNQKVID